MATSYVVIEIGLSDSVTQANGHIKDATLNHEGIQNLINLLKKINCGGKDVASVTVAVRSTTSTPTSSGGGTTAVTYNNIS